jgi:hypothetical protein
MAVARKLAVILFAMWRDGTEYRWGADPMAKTARRSAKPSFWRPPNSATGQNKGTSLSEGDPTKSA